MRARSQMCAFKMYAVTNVTSIYKILNIDIHLKRDEDSVVVVAFNIDFYIKFIKAVTNVTSIFCIINPIISIHFFFKNILSVR